MSSYFDKQFIQQHLSNRLELFTWSREWLGNFRCCLCGDSKKRLNMKRGFFYRCLESDTMRFKCHNCQEASGWSLGAWLSIYDKTLQQQYNFENFKDGDNHTTGYNLEKAPKQKVVHVRQHSLVKDDSVSIPKELLLHSVRLSDLPPDHLAVKYILGRKIPKRALERLLYVDDFNEFSMSLDTHDMEVAEKAPKDARIVIPFLNRNGDDFVCFQGRALDKDAYIRYFTIKKYESSEKIFGLDTLKPSKTKLVVEGPLDSLFLPNCVATADSNLLKYSNGDIYIPDNQYHNKEICKGIEDIIRSGKRICLFPKEYSEFKDINEFIEGGVSIKDLLGIIANNTFKGLKAKHRWSILKGV